MNGRPTAEIDADLWAMSGLVIGTAQIREISDRLIELDAELTYAATELRGANDRLDAVNAALDQYDNADSPSGHGPFAAAECVSAVAEACGR